MPTPGNPLYQRGRTIRKLDLSDPREVTDVLDLQRSAYAVEAGLLGSEVPLLKDTTRILQDCGETFYGYFAEDELVGTVSFKRTDSVLDIHRLVVHPEHFRRGIGRSLMVHAEGVAGPVDRIIVSTGSKNSPARHPYRSLGFRETGASKPVRGLWRSNLRSYLGNPRVG